MGKQAEAELPESLWIFGLCTAPVRQQEEAG